MIYVINVLTGKEKEIAQAIEGLYNENIKNIYNPLSIFGTPVFPSYIFLEAELTGELYYEIRNIPGVIYFLDPNLGTTPIDPQEEEKIKEKPQVSLIDRPVKIVSGPYEGTNGLIKEIKYPYISIKPESFYYLESTPNLKIHVKHLVLADTIFEPGMRVQVIKGDYEGLKGIIEQVDYPIIHVLTSIFDKEIIIELHASEIRSDQNGNQCNWDY